MRLPVIVVAAVFFMATSPLAADDSSEQLFTKRILPIFKSPNPSSCTQCHLAGLDLKEYILPSHEKTFLSLRDQGLIDTANPAKSKILHWIEMDDPKAPATLIQANTRRAEYDAFAAWIAACVADTKLVAAPKLSPSELAEPKKPDEVIRHARKDRLLESFENTIWAMRFRCMNCHIEGTKENKERVAKFGEQVAWMKAAGPEATMDYLISTDLININKPEQSLLLLKPLKAVEHGGGKKFLIDDQGYLAFRSWIDDYAKIVKNKYTTAASLPKTQTDRQFFGSESWLKIANTPEVWGDALVQVDVHARDAKTGGWDPLPIAFTDRANFGKGRTWQHTITLAAPKDSDLAVRWKQGNARLPAGQYLVKAYVMQNGKRLPAGQTEVESRWETGYQKMTVVEGSKLRPN